MKRLLAIVGAVAFAAALVVPVHADIQSPVEQESPNFFDNNCSIDFSNPACDSSLWVNNPTTCVWDLDDHDVLWTTSATLPANASVSDSLCVIADQYDNFAGDGKLWAGRVVAKSANVSLTVTSSLGDRWVAGPPVRSGGQYTYTICGGEGPVFQYAGPWDVIPGSNGGTGKRIDFTLHVSVPKKVTGATVIFETYGLPVQADFYGICP